MSEDGDLHHQQQKCNADGNDNDTDTKHEEVSEENEGNLDIFDDVLEEAPEATKSQQKKIQHSDHHGNAHTVL